MNLEELDNKMVRIKQKYLGRVKKKMLLGSKREYVWSEGGIEKQIHQVFKNLTAVCEASKGSLSDIVKLNIFLTDLNNFATLNEIMSSYFTEPYPARAAIGVNELPKGVSVEMDGVMVTSSDSYSF